MRSRHRKIPPRRTSASRIIRGPQKTPSRCLLRPPLVSSLSANSPTHCRPAASRSRWLGFSRPAVTERDSPLEDRPTVPTPRREFTATDGHPGTVAALPADPGRRLPAADDLGVCPARRRRAGHQAHQPFPPDRNAARRTARAVGKGRCTVLRLGRLPRLVLRATQDSVSGLRGGRPWPCSHRCCDGFGVSTVTTVSLVEDLERRSSPSNHATLRQTRRAL
jgi:hypothetical protein